MSTTEFNAVALVARGEEPQVLETVSQLIALLEKRGLPVWVGEDSQFKSISPVQHCAEEDLREHCDLFIVVGGDGTMLHAAQLIRRAAIPLMGINRGRRGFLADIRPNELEERVDAILRGEYLRESRMMLTATLSCSGGDATSYHALNDVVVQRGAMGQTLDFDVHVDGRYVNTHRGDGLIITTPTGSTAYALSSGGPIMQPGLNAIAMVPICPHTLSDRPVVIPGNATIDITVKPRFDADAFMTVDGKMSAQVNTGDRLQVTQSVDRITLLHPTDYDYFEVLRSKLNWGQYERSVNY